MHVEGHLGGYRVGGDEATFYPALWEWLVRSLNVVTVLDVGCGEGQAVEYFRRLDCAVLGVDGVKQDLPYIVTHDYTVGHWRPPLLTRRELGLLPCFDLVWCCEFVEHVEEQYVPNFLATFQCADLVLMTHAEPGQAGHHHVNCQPASYWINTMANAGFILDDELTTTTRELAAFNPNPWNHYVRSGMAFRRA